MDLSKVTKNFQLYQLIKFLKLTKFANLVRLIISIGLWIMDTQYILMKKYISFNISRQYSRTVGIETFLVLLKNLSIRKICPL